MTPSSDIDTIRAHADRILASGILGRSRFYSALLEYLVAAAEHDHAPKEIEIAAEVFQRGDRFDPSQDSMVRVYAHNLRQKLQQYYAGEGKSETRQLAIPKGEYRVVLAERDRETGAAHLTDLPLARRVDWGRAAGVAALTLLGVLAGVTLDRVIRPVQGPAATVYADVAATPIWSPIFDDDLPIVVVVGDYYIFGELDPQGGVDRLVREFDINSSRDLDELMMVQPDLASRYMDLDLTYLPSSTAVAMRALLRVLYTSGKTVRVVSMSKLDAVDIRDNHVVYVGYISALDKLLDFVFMASELAIGGTYDELVDTVTGASFYSEAGLPTERGNYRDYGLFSTFPGPNGNQFLIIAGTRDEGLMQTAQALSDPGYVASSLEAVAGPGGETPKAFELLYEVAGFDRTNLDATIVHASALDYESIWTGELALH